MARRAAPPRRCSCRRSRASAPRFWAPEARGGWVGLSLATRRADLVRAVASGIAAQVATLGEAMAADLGRPLRALRVDGGLARSEVLTQAQADLLQVPSSATRRPTPRRSLWLRWRASG